jgi:hypothetical protein
MTWIQLPRTVLAALVAVLLAGEAGELGHKQRVLLAHVGAGAVQPAAAVVALEQEGGRARVHVLAAYGAGRGRWRKHRACGPSDRWTCARARRLQSGRRVSVALTQLSRELITTAQMARDDGLSGTGGAARNQRLGRVACGRRGQRRMCVPVCMGLCLVASCTACTKCSALADCRGAGPRASEAGCPFSASRRREEAEQTGETKLG